MNARKALPFVVYAFLVALPGGCGGDDDSDDASGGAAGRQGGAAGKAGGAGGLGGAKATGGAGTAKGGASATGGMASKGGATSSGGMPQAGAGGFGEGGTGPGGASFGGSSGGTTIGSGGSGTGGTTQVSGGAGGAAGEFSGGSGGGGAGGADAGGGGAGGDPNAVAESCAEVCKVDGDCFKTAGLSNGRICDPSTHRCVVHTCDTDTNCVPVGTAWTTVCTTDGNCSSSESCIDVRGAGRCATLPNNGACSGGMETVSWKHFGDNSDVTICGDTSFKCRANNCVKPCTSTSCTAPGTACNSVTGACDLCASDAGCGGPTKPPHCNVSTGRCECLLDSDCAAVINTNVCVNGRCGCTADSVCTRKTGNNSTLICE